MGREPFSLRFVMERVCDCTQCPCNRANSEDAVLHLSLLLIMGGGIYLLRCIHKNIVIFESASFLEVMAVHLVRQSGLMETSFR